MNIICIVLVSLGAFFLLMGAVEILRFPDFYSRMHAAGKCDTLGSLLVVLGLAFHADLLSAAKIFFIAIFIFWTSPTATHAIARAALRNKIPWWTRGEG